MNYMYEMYFKEIYKERLAQAEATRLINEAHKHNQTADWKSSRTLTDVLQKYRLIIVGVYHDLYKRSKSLTA